MIDPPRLSKKYFQSAFVPCPKGKGASLKRKINPVPLLLYAPHKPFYFTTTTICTVLLLIPNCLAVCLTVAKIKHSPQHCSAWYASLHKNWLGNSTISSGQIDFCPDISLITGNVITKLLKISCLFRQDFSAPSKYCKVLIGFRKQGRTWL